MSDECQYCAFYSRQISKKDDLIDELKEKLAKEHKEFTDITLVIEIKKDGGNCTQARWKGHPDNDGPNQICGYGISNEDAIDQLLHDLDLEDTLRNLIKSTYGLETKDGHEQRK